MIQEAIVVQSSPGLKPVCKRWVWFKVCVRTVIHILHLLKCDFNFTYMQESIAVQRYPHEINLFDSELLNIQETSVA